jgi:hypothetical protein
MKSLFEAVDYKANAREWEEFLKGSIWHDLQLFISDRIEINRDMLELTEDERKIAAQEKGNYESSDLIRGRNREAKMILFAPEEILHELQDEQEQENTNDR